MILTLVANVLILICFKLFPRYGINNLNAIVVNYLTAVLTGVVVLGELPFGMDAIDQAWFPYALFLGFIFVTIFNVVALTVQKTGVVIGTLFQKMSLLFPVVAAMLFFGEPIIILRIIGIALAILSIIIINLPKKNGADEFNALRKYWYLPLLTLLGSGLIELLLYYVDVKKIAPNGDIGFVCFLFFTAGCIGLIFKIVTGRIKIGRKDLIAGICLGIPNFFSIYLLLKSLSVGVDASVMFPFINVGTILSGVILGFVVFKEEINKTKVMGVITAIIAIILIVS